MRMKCDSYKDAERLSNFFEECHIDHNGKHWYVVVDKVKRRKANA